MSFEIDISNNLEDQAVDIPHLQRAVEHALRTEKVRSAVISISIVDNPTIHKLNRQHLQHDYPTDVISFQLDWHHDDLQQPSITPSGRSADASIEGEVIVSSDYAAASASEIGWSTENELTLYIVHGLLHICGYDDLSDDEKRIMRLREKDVLQGLGLNPTYPDDVIGGAV